MKLASCRVNIAPLRSKAEDGAEMVSQLLFGEPVDVLEVASNWTLVRSAIDGYEGWMDTKQLLPMSPKEWKRWQDGLGMQGEFLLRITGGGMSQLISRGAYLPEECDETFQMGTQNYLVEVVLDDSGSGEEDTFRALVFAYEGSPYLWGGKSPFGIDCSGYTQQVYRSKGINLPRDASEQVLHGREIPFDELEFGDLAFFHNAGGKVTHVGIVLDEGRIMHAHGWVRNDELRVEGIWNNDQQRLTHTLNCVKRF
ncbi:MAG: hydrolase Nlp/P60 [Bacteroidetes bacterium]|nr:MAG: hydrolase Nlp/P60 [Bacteroidota bacterium]